MPAIKSKINILWLVDHLGFHGDMHGAGKYYLDTIPFINKQKYGIILCVLRKRDRLSKYFEDRGIKIKHLERSKFDPLTLVDVLSIIKNESVELIHAHGYGASNFGRLSGAIARIPVIVHAHDNDPIYPTYQKIADRLLFRLTHKAIAVSESVKESCIQKRKIPKNRICVVNNGISLKDFSLPTVDRTQKERDRLGIKMEYRIVGTVTRLREEKGVRYLIESVQRVLQIFPETIFLIAGDGPLRAELCNLTRTLGICDKVIFGGFCEDIPAILSILNIFVMPSLSEGFPLALVEAMATGKPIIATNVGGMKEILKDGETGLLIPEKDPKALSDKIIYLLRNKSIAQGLGQRAQEESKKYDLALHLKRLENNYNKLIFCNKTDYSTGKPSNSMTTR